MTQTSSMSRLPRRTYHHLRLVEVRALPSGLLLLETGIRRNREIAAARQASPRYQRPVVTNSAKAKKRPTSTTSIVRANGLCQSNRLPRYMLTSLFDQPGLVMMIGLFQSGGSTNFLTDFNSTVRIPKRIDGVPSKSAQRITAGHVEPHFRCSNLLERSGSLPRSIAATGDALSPLPCQNQKIHVCYMHDQCMTSVGTCLTRVRPIVAPSERAGTAIEHTAVRRLIGGTFGPPSVKKI